MTSTALIQLGGQTALTEVEAAILAEMQDESNAYDPQFPRIKVAPGGIGQFLVGEDTAKSFTGVVVISRKIRGYWPDSGTGAPPLCSSPDGAHGLFNSDAPDTDYAAAMKTKFPHRGVVMLTENLPLPTHFDCASCPLSQWGSEHQRRGGAGKGKACKEMRRLLVLVDGFAMPAIFNLPPTSIRAWDSFASGLAARRSAYFAVKVKFELDSAKATGGETYNVVKVSLAGALDAGQVGMVGEIRRQYMEFFAGMAIDSSEYDEQPANGNAPTIHVDAPPLPENDVQFEDGEALFAQPELVKGGKRITY